MKVVSRAQAGLHEVFRLYMRSFPLTWGKERLLAYFWRPLCFGDYHRQTCLAHYPVTVRMDLDLTQYIQRHLYFFGGYEYDNTLFWLKQAAQANVIFDLGANVGLYSLLAAAHNQRGMIHAFEPKLELVDKLRANLDLNGLSNVVVNPLAVGAVNAQLYLHHSRGADGSNEGMNYVSKSPTGMAVEVLTLDDYCTTHGINHVDLMKIDIEGGEFDALTGAAGLLRRRAIGCVLFELVDWAAQRGGHSPQDILDLFTSQGYRLYDLQRGRLQPIDPATHKANGDLIAMAQPLIRDS